MEQGHCRLLAVTPVGPPRVQLLCAGDQSWLARGSGASLKLRRLHPFIRGYAYSHAFQRGGKIEVVRGFDQKIRHIVVDRDGKAAIRDWPSSGGTLVAATAGLGDSVTVLLRHGNDYYINDIEKTDKAAGRSVPWIFAEAGLVDEAVGFIPQDGEQAPPAIWLGGKQGIVIGGPEAVTSRLPIQWSPSTALLAVATEPGRAAFVVRDDSGVRVIHKAARGEWVAVHVGGTASMAESTCAASLNDYFTAPGRKSCTRRGHRVEVAALVIRGSSLWLVLGTHRHERRIHQRVEGGGAASSLRGDLLASRDRVELSLLEIVAGSTSAPSWRIAAAKSVDLGCDDPSRACHALDDLAAVRMAVARNVVHVAAQSSERLHHFAVEISRRRPGDRPVTLARKVLREETPDPVKDPVPAVARAPEPQVQAKPPQAPICAAGQTRCAARLCADLRSSANHCGACGHRCVSGRCDRGKCAPVCHRDSDCDPRAKRPGAGFSQVCIHAGRTFGGAGPGRGCVHSGCHGDMTCSKVTGRCVPRSCRRRSDCKLPGARCVAPDGQRKARCLPPGHCGAVPRLPRSRGR